MVFLCFYYNPPIHTHTQHNLHNTLHHILHTTLKSKDIGSYCRKITSAHDSQHCHAHLVVALPFNNNKPG